MKLLQDVNINNLDEYESRLYYQYREKGIKHLESLQLIINQVEGDESQLSDELKGVNQ